MGVELFVLVIPPDGRFSGGVAVGFCLAAAAAAAGGFSTLRLFWLLRNGLCDSAGGATGGGGCGGCGGGGIDAAGSTPGVHLIFLNNRPLPPLHPPISCNYRRPLCSEVFCVLALPLGLRCRQHLQKSPHSPQFHTHHHSRLSPLLPQQSKG